MQLPTFYEWLSVAIAIGGNIVTYRVVTRQIRDSRAAINFDSGLSQPIGTLLDELDSVVAEVQRWSDSEGQNNHEDLRTKTIEICRRVGRYTNDAATIDQADKGPWTEIEADLVLDAANNLNPSFRKTTGSSLEQELRRVSEQLSVRLRVSRKRFASAS